MPSKGITVYSYISVDGYEIEFTVPKIATRNTAADNFTSKDLEVESSNIEGLRKYTGRFKWQVLDPEGVVIGSAFNNVNSLTGSLEGGSMTSTVNQFPQAFKRFCSPVTYLTGPRLNSNLSSPKMSSSLMASTTLGMGKLA